MAVYILPVLANCSNPILCLTITCIRILILTSSKCLYRLVCR